MKANHNPLTDNEYELDCRFFVYNETDDVVSGGFQCEDDAIDFAVENNFPTIKQHNYYIDRDKHYPDGDPVVVWGSNVPNLSSDSMPGSVVNATVYDCFSGRVKVVENQGNKWLVEIVDVCMCYPQQSQSQPGEQYWINEDELDKGESSEHKDIQNIVAAMYVSFWDNCARIEFPCKVNLKTKEVYDIEIEPDVIDEFEVFQGCWVRLNDGSEFELCEKNALSNNEDVYWFDEVKALVFLNSMTSLDSQIIQAQKAHSTENKELSNIQLER